MLKNRDYYYPFGLSINALSSSAPLSKPNDFRYNGKEFSTDFDLNWYDYGARQYDPQIGRWMAPDPMADAYLEFSPYTYVANNPIKYIDPDGNIITDKDGNIVVTTTGKQISSGPQQVSDVRKNSDGTQSATFISRTYEVVNIFADNGTPIEALRLVAAEQVEATFDAEGNLLGSTTESVNSEQYDCTADCHGYTFADDRLWINDDQVEKLLENDGYISPVDEEDASAVIFKKNGSVVHSAGRNADGTYNNNAGIMTTEYNVTLDAASRGLTDTGNSNNVQFVRKRYSNRALDTKLGKVDSQGRRVISDKKEIKQFLDQLNGNE